MLSTHCVHHLFGNCNSHSLKYLTCGRPPLISTRHCRRRSRHRLKRDGLFERINEGLAFRICEATCYLSFLLRPCVSRAHPWAPPPPRVLPVPNSRTPSEPCAPLRLEEIQNVTWFPSLSSSWGFNTYRTPQSCLDQEYRSASMTTSPSTSKRPQR